MSGSKRAYRDLVVSEAELDKRGYINFAFCLRSNFLRYIIVRLD